MVLLPIPLDLHVLSLQLAFILSQDQTLHSSFFNSNLNPKIQTKAVFSSLLLFSYLYFENLPITCLFKCWSVEVFKHFNISTLKLTNPGSLKSYLASSSTTFLRSLIMLLSSFQWTFFLISGEWFLVDFISPLNTLTWLPYSRFLTLWFSHTFRERDGKDKTNKSSGQEGFTLFS